MKYIYALKSVQWNQWRIYVRRFKSSSRKLQLKNEGSDPAREDYLLTLTLVALKDLKPYSRFH